MDFDWLSRANPVAIWWVFLIGVSVANIAALLLLIARYRSAAANRRTGRLAIEPLLVLGAIYVVGCAFRSVLPRADVQRICLFDTWLSSIFIGRSVATAAELCFALQWAIVLRTLGNLANSDTAKNISKAIMPLIAVAECCSWYAVITTNFLGNVIENSLWTITFALIAVALVQLLTRFRGIVQFILAALAAGLVCYAVFMCMIDVPMYFSRWQMQVAIGQGYYGLISGVHDLATRWIVTRDITQWRDEIPWMSLYFSLAVWTSLALASFGLVKHHLPRYRVSRRIPRSATTPLAAAVRSP
jgi:hypothetical protein